MTTPTEADMEKAREISPCTCWITIPKHPSADKHHLGRCPFVKAYFAIAAALAEERDGERKACEVIVERLIKRDETKQWFSGVEALCEASSQIRARTK